jgi:hypothetical protein
VVAGFFTSCLFVLQIFSWFVGSLVPKLVGEKKTRLADFHMTPSNSFFLKFPVLAKYIDSVLKSAVNDQTDNVLSVKLFPALSILCRLSPDLEPDSDDHRYNAWLLCCVLLMHLICSFVCGGGLTCLSLFRLKGVEHHLVERVKFK